LHVAASGTKRRIGTVDLCKVVKRLSQVIATVFDYLRESATQTMDYLNRIKASDAFGQVIDSGFNRE
jgi:hypothetical protein